MTNTEARQAAVSQPIGASPRGDVAATWALWGLFLAVTTVEGVQT